MSNINQWNYQLLEFIPHNNEEYLTLYNPITSSMVILSCQNRFLFGFNTLRKRWEVPCGRIEQEETTKECAKRELYEETCQRIDDLNLYGVAKIYDHYKGLIKYRAIYGVEVTKLQPFNETSEMNQLCLWDLETDLGEVDQVDCEIIKCIHNR